MRNFILAIIVIVTISSCNTQKVLAKYLTQHNYQQSVKVNPLTHKTTVIASIDSLYDYSQVQKLCSQADVTFHISKGSITVYAECQEAVNKVSELLKKLLESIKFK